LCWYYLLLKAYMRTVILIILVGLINLPNVALADLGGERIIPFIPQYNKDISESFESEKLIKLDLKRIERLRREYDLDWYHEYCGDPWTRDKEGSSGCIEKFNNLSEAEAKSLIIYKTNFSDPELVDPELQTLNQDLHHMLQPLDQESSLT